MKRKLEIGLVCDLGFTKHSEFRNYYFALLALYGNVKIVLHTEDLNHVGILFIGDDHYSVHKCIINQPGFVEKCNNKGIKVVVFGAERIFGTIFSWNEDNYKFLQGFDNLYHYNYDVDDCKRLGTKLHRLCPSKNYQDIICIDYDYKCDRAVFIGSLNGPAGQYTQRKELIRKLQKTCPLDVFDPQIQRWEAYLQKMAVYRFVLSPLGNANGLVSRFYEALLVNSIPIQQVKSDTLEMYDIESGFEDCLFFQDAEEVPDLIDKCKLGHSENQIWLEDYLETLLKADNLL
jgi:hypothetical protein